MVAVGVVELGRAETDLDVGDARVVRSAADEGAILGANDGGVDVADRVAEEVGRELLVVCDGCVMAEGCEGALELRGHRVKKDGRGLLRGLQAWATAAQRR